MKFLLLLVLSSFSALAAPQLSPFTSDGCSSWHEGPLWDIDQWEICCFEHDVSYWMGGPRSERRKADERLMQCVGEKAHLLEGWIMYSGVRFGGRPYYPTPYRWGYGWDYMRDYYSLTSSEKKMIEESLRQSQFSGEEDVIIQRAIRRLSK